MDNLEIMNKIEVCIYSISSKFNETISRGRARIFYTGQNRNRTYITEEFAAKLLDTIAYAPVKGIWVEDDEDFTTHGKSRDEGRIYGVVPSDYNLGWEVRLDDDGVERNYACVDVLLYTALYPEASEIIGKSLSMEIYPPSIKGNWEIINGQKLFKYSAGHFLGLQALGDTVEPCFEGAAFYELLKDLKDVYAALEQYQLTLEGGKNEMPVLNFKLSDREKYDALWTLLNPEYNEENNYTISVNIVDIYDDYALCRDYESGEFFRQAYQKDENGVELGEKSKCYILEVSEEEYAALNRMRETNEGSFTKVEENFNKALTDVETLTEANATLTTDNTTLAETAGQVEGLHTTIQTLEEEKTTQATCIEKLTEELNGLHEFKKNIEDKEKETILNKYAPKLDDAVVETYSKKLGEYTAKDLEKDLAYELVQGNPSVFSVEVPPAIPKDQPLTGIEAILNKYSKKNNQED